MFFQNRRNHILETNVQHTNKIFFRNVIPLWFLLPIEFKLRWQGEIAMWLWHPVLILVLNIFGCGGGRREDQ